MSPATIGLVMTIGGLVGLTVQTPVGAYIDAAIRKRAVVVIASAVLAAAALAVMLLPSFIVVLTANTMMAVAGDVFAPAVAAITLGLYGRNALAKRMGRNAAFDHAGNVAIALIAAGVGWSISQRAVFLLVPLFAACVSLAVLSVPAGTIDHARARGHPTGSNTLRALERFFRVVLEVKLSRVADRSRHGILWQSRASRLRALSCGRGHRSFQDQDEEPADERYR